MKISSNRIIVKPEYDLFRLSDCDEAANLEKFQVYVRYDHNRVYVGRSVNWYKNRLPTKAYTEERIISQSIVILTVGPSNDFVFNQNEMNYVEEQLIQRLSNLGVTLENKANGTYTPVPNTLSDVLDGIVTDYISVLRNYNVVYIPKPKQISKAINNLVDKNDLEVIENLYKDHISLPEVKHIIPESILKTFNNKLKNIDYSSVLIIQSPSLVLQEIKKGTQEVIYISSCSQSIEYVQNIIAESKTNVKIIKVESDEQILDKLNNMKNKFDVVIANPPYSRLYQKIYERAKQISKEQIFVIPSRNVLLKQKSNDIISVELIAAPSFNKLFNNMAGIQMPGMVIHSSEDHNSEEINYTDQYGTKAKTTVKYITQCKFKGSKQLVDLVSNTQNNIESYNKGKFEYYINKLYGFGKQGNCLAINIKGMPTNHRPNRMCFKFETEKERYNFDQFLISKFSMCVMNILKTNQHLNFDLLSKFPLPNDFKTFMTDDDIAKYFNLTQDSIDFVNSIAHIHPRREK